MKRNKILTVVRKQETRLPVCTVKWWCIVHGGIINWNVALISCHHIQLRIILRLSFNTPAVFWCLF